MGVSAAEVRESAERVGASLPEEGARRLAVYVDALLAANRTVNVTAARDPDDALDVLVVPSLAVEHAWPAERAPLLALDIGSGNGFPGVAVAVRWPACRMVLVERRARKARVIEQALEAAEIENASVLACDVRELPRLRPDLAAAMDLVCARAVGPLGRTTRMAAGLLAVGGRLVQWKAHDLDDDERSEGVRVARAAGLRVLPDVEIEAGRGRLVVYERPADAV